MNKIMSALGGSASGGKKILVSLSIIAAVAAIVVGATTAYFSDTETSIGNTLSAGTIDIAIDGQNPWEKSFDLGDLKPSETGYINFRINNVGQNPVNISKKLYGIEGNGGVEKYDCIVGQTNYKASSEPECVAEQRLTQREDDIQKVIIYDLSVEVYDGQNKIWWQTIYSDGEGKSIASVYGQGGGTSVKLGMIPVGGYMLVTQSYHLSGELTGNEYQGDGLTFNIEIRGDQLNQPGGATVTLENKSGAPDWNIIETDNINGVLTYQTKGPKFEYIFTGHVANDGDYTLIYVGPSGNYPCNGSKVIGSGSSSGGVITLSGSPDLNVDITDGKIWLVPSSTYSTGTNTMTGWDHANNLYETALISYDDTDL